MCAKARLWMCARVCLLSLLVYICCVRICFCLSLDLLTNQSCEYVLARVFLCVCICA